MFKFKYFSDNEDSNPGRCQNLSAARPKEASFLFPVEKIDNGGGGFLGGKSEAG